jgi:hypothetical protein
MNEGTRSGKSTIGLQGISAERPTNGLYLYLYLNNVLGTFMFAFLLDVEIESKKNAFLICVPEKRIIKYSANPTNLVLILLISQ